MARADESMEPSNAFETDVVYEFFKDVWARDAKAAEEDGLKEMDEDSVENDTETAAPAAVLEPAAGIAAAESSKKPRTTVNINALKVACELLKLFVTETVHRAAMVADAEDSTVIEGTHLERILPQLLHDF